MDRDDTIPDTRPHTPTAPLSLRGYRVGEVIGKGGMGEVLLVRDPEIGRDVALKRMADDAATPEALERFLREARIQARLEHPAIVPVHELGRDAEGRPYFTMKRLTGTTLYDVLRTGERALQPLLRALVDACLAIGFAHTRGVVHRDLKPANIMLGDFGEVYVLDWGLARVVSEPDAPHSSDDIASHDSGATQAGALLGTPGYMPPEQIRDATSVGPPADVYALGCILFELLAGEPVHARDDAIASTVARPTRAPASVRAVAPELDAACVAALAEDPAARPTARALADRIQHYLDGDRDVERRRALAAEELARARAALADPARRGEASRLAGHALALDPDSRDAAALVTQLIVQPPQIMPGELAHRLVRFDRVLSLRSVGLARVSLLGVFVIAPLVLWSGVADRLGVLVLLTYVAIMIAVADYLVRRQRTADVLALALNTVMVVMLSRLFGSFIFVPPMVCLIAWGLGQQAALLDRRWLFGTALFAGYLVPLVLEWAGVFQQTVAIAGDRVVITSPMLHVSGTAAYALLVGGNLMMIVVAVVFGQEVATTRRRAQHVLEMQAWHLEKMVQGLQSTK